jgi:hypothetical protein
MQFKIDAKGKYTVITPESGSADANLSAALAQTCAHLTEKGSSNFIIDLQYCQSATKEALEQLAEAGAGLYEQGISFVLANVNAPLLQQIKEADLIDALNHAPTVTEAKDIINMEIIERNLSSEE